MASTDIDDLIETLEQSPWSAPKTLKPLSASTRKKVHQALLDRCRETPTDGIVGALAQFPTPATTAALIALLQKRVDTEVLEATAEVLGDFAENENKRAIDALRTLVSHRQPSVARAAIEGLPPSSKNTALVLSRFDACAKSGDDLLLLAAVEHLAPVLATNDEVVAAFARHWDFGTRGPNTLMASNAIFDALIADVPSHPAARAVFETAAKHPSEYAKVRGLAALALCGVDTNANAATLKKLKLKNVSSKSLRSAALKRLDSKKK